MFPFLLTLLLTILAPTSESSTLPLDCSAHDLATCLQPYMSYALDTDGSATLKLVRTDPTSVSDTQFASLCSVSRNLTSCLEKFVSRCRTTPGTLNFTRGLKELAENCNRATFGKSAQGYFSCVKNLSDTNARFKECQDEFMTTIGAQDGLRGVGISLVEELNGWKSGNETLVKVCKARKKYEACSAADIAIACGQDVAGTTRTLHQAVVESLQCSRAQKNGFTSHLLQLLLFVLVLFHLEFLDS